MEKEIIDELFFEFEEELEKYMVIRAGRANPHILDKISIDYYGVPTQIKQMANISVQEARILCITVWDASQVKNVSKAIAASDIGITPSDDGKVIRLVFPQLTEERRKELTKTTKKMGEDAKVAIRNLRREANDILKKQQKEGELTEDDLKGELEEVQKKIEKAVKEIDSIVAAKDKEIMEV